MNFKKINENKLIITLKNTELPNAIDLDDFMSNSENARISFINMLSIANEKVGFDVSDCKVKINAKSDFNGICTFEIIKLIKKSNIHSGNAKSVRPKKVLINNNFISDQSINEKINLIYSFNCFDDFIDFCLELKNNNVNYIDRFSKHIALYQYNKIYYLLVKNVNKKYKYLANFYSLITEFAKIYPSSNLFISILDEYGSIIIKNNAITICQKNFKSITD